MAERSSALDSSSGVVRMWVRIPVWTVAVLVYLSKTLNHNCFVLRMGRKAVGPVCCVMHVKEPRTLIVKENGLAPVFLDSRLEHPAGCICARYKSSVLLLSILLLYLKNSVFPHCLIILFILIDEYYDFLSQPCYSQTSHLPSLNIVFVVKSTDRESYDKDKALSFVDKEGNTALHSAVNSGDYAAVKLCLKYGARIDVQQGIKCKVTASVSTCSHLIIFVF